MESSPNHDDFDHDDNPPLIDFDFQTGQFNLKTIHPSLKRIFKTLGISKKDLKDKRMVPVIFDCVIRAFSELHTKVGSDNKKPIKKSFDLAEEVDSDGRTPQHKDLSAMTKQCVIKFDLTAGVFEIEHLHPTLRRIFRKAGISKKDLRDKQMAIAIMRAIIESFCEINDLTESKQMLETGDLLKL